MRPVILILLALILLVSCGDPPMVREKQTVDGVTIFLERPERVVLEREAELIVTLVASDDRVINGAIVSLDLDMPEMPMGQNRPLADGLGGGKYRVRTTYSMIGTWNMTVLAVIEGREYRATFHQEVMAP